ncbi:hypothetical protein KIN20_017133 [Parelaphostrongylus tenuis]|uniref:Uncharacterized protein n=1 Tax=Parelaphostrongylus tenuis TaxID=148309 RepID=A0AAD5MI65_PARTN|nr:hypothetical protein KIN20_017133 [Parelaphostrongylus tenuis]
MIVLNSFMISCLITSVIRICMLIQELTTPAERILPHKVLIWQTIWVGAVYTACHHPLLLAFERLLAVMRSRTYEKEKNVLLLLFSIFCTLIYSFIIAYLPAFTTFSKFLACCSYLIVSAISIMTIVYIRRSNLALWRSKRGVLDISHNYQVRENVETAMWLFRFMSISFGQTLIAWTAVMVTMYFMEAKVPVLEKTFAFVFNLCISLLPTTSSIVLYYHNNKINAAYKQCFSRCSCYGPEGVLRHTDKIVGFEGNQLRFDVKEEGINYFQQYQAAWS